MAFGEEGPFIPDGPAFAGSDLGVEQFHGLPVCFLLSVGEHSRVVDGAFKGAFLASPELDHRCVADGPVGNSECFRLESDLEAESTFAEPQEILVCRECQGAGGY